MASLCKVSLFFILIYFSLQVYTPTAMEYGVGDENGWAVPKAKYGDQMYNKWASGKRFKIDDTVRFKYKKDSVMVISEEEYKKCRATHPVLYSNNGNTVFKLDRPGLFYFMSGVAGHCERGQKMIIKVLEPSPPPQSQNQTTPDSDSKKNNAPAIAAPSIILLIISFLCLIFYQF